MSSKITKEKAASIFDMGGSLLMHNYQYKNTAVIYPKVRLVVGKNRFPILDWLKHNFGGCISAYNNNRRYWEVGSNKAMNFIKAIAPLLMNKKKIKQANWLIKHWPKILDNGRTERNSSLRKKLLKRFRSLKIKKETQ